MPVDGKHTPTPSSEFFGNSEYSESRSGSSSSSLSINTDNSMGLTPAERAYAKAIEHASLVDSNESDEEEESSGSETAVRLAPTRSSKGFCTLNLEDEDVLYSPSNVL
jgi:hypothetical protein